MSLRERYDFENLVNEAERLVLEEIERQLGRLPSVCSCQECVLDIAAYALNQVRPRYHASLLGSIYAIGRGDPGGAREIQLAVSEAIKRIQANPAHD